MTVGAAGSRPRLDELPEPVAAAGETLVELDAAAAGHLDLTIAAGEFPFRPPEPYVPGTDGSGRVLSSAAHPSGTRVWIRGGGVGIARDGCWAERAAVPDEAVHVLAEEVAPELAATFFVPSSTAHLAVHAIGALAAGERVAVRGGAGAVGALAVQLALAGGAGDVLAIVRTDEQMARVPPGARAVVAPDAAALSELAGADVDLLVDTVGGPDLAAVVPAIRPGGRIALVGYVAGVTAELPITGLIGQDVRLLPVNGLRNEVRAFDTVAPELLRELAAGRLRLPVRTHPLERVDDAIADVRSGGGGRVALLL
ncbi:MAG TPA: zinc-binding alcohol dehydrogenase family protein [Gaiellaceae bacterium]|nr:zinc-binding alcohol dehydrogenase family protein [Gaiellaceae bacterium]